MMLLFKRYITCAWLGLSVLLLSACDTSENENGLGENEETSEKINWSWDAFPQSSEMVLSTLPMDIQPKESFEIRSEASGIITLEIDKKVSLVESDKIIARMNVETLEEQATRIKIQEEEKVLNNIKAEKLDLPEERKTAKEELDKARKKVRLIEMLLKNPAMKEYAGELGLGGDINELSNKTLKEAKEALSLAEAKMAWADTYGDKIRKGKLKIQDMDLTKTKRQHEEARELSVYKTPFAGELRLELNYVDGQKEYTVTGRETIATLNNYDEIHGHLKVGNAKWVNMPPKQLYVQLNDRNKTIMNFNDERIEKDKRTQREERKYIFSIPQEANKSLKRLVGTQLNGDLVYRLPTKCYIVPKYDLSLYALGKTDSTEWNTMVRQLWSDVTVVAEGRKYLALSRGSSRAAAN
ncbi:MAG: hypothetical protein AB8F34_07945 [Akkermansiaceae bacterium]